MNSKQLAIITILTALSIGTNYAMISFYNVKFMDLIVFIGGFCFGPFVGASIGVVSWTVYGSLNPLGFSLPIWISTIVSESIYGVAGGISRGMLSSGEATSLGSHRISTYAFFGAAGMLLTFVYDIITNIVFGYISGWSILFAVIVGFFPFGLVHVVSNGLFFGLGCAPTIKAILKVVGGRGLGVSKE
jgi:hypothetical protein